MAAEASLVALQEDFTKLRKHLHCQICTELLFEPMVLSGCGHIFCYGCSYDWLKTHKTCPTCRAKVKLKPAPIYIIKELVSVIASRIELQAPLDEIASMQQHREEQRLMVADHRFDLYPNLFAEPNLHGGRAVDLEDRVMRCTTCHWEIDGTICAGCGRDYGSEASDDDRLLIDPDGDMDPDMDASFSDLEGPNEYDHEDSFIDDGPSSQSRITNQIDSLEDDEEPISIASDEDNAINDRDTSIIHQRAGLQRHFTIESEDEFDDEFEGFADGVGDDGGEYDVYGEDYDAALSGGFGDSDDEDRQTHGFELDRHFSPDGEGSNDEQLDLDHDSEREDTSDHDDLHRNSGLESGTDDLEMMDEEDFKRSDVTTNTHRARRIICDSDEDEP